MAGPRPRRGTVSRFELDTRELTVERITLRGFRISAECPACSRRVMYGPHARVAVESPRLGEELTVTIECDGCGTLWHAAVALRVQLSVFDDDAAIEDDAARADRIEAELGDALAERDRLRDTLARVRRERNAGDARRTSPTPHEPGGWDGNGSPVC